MGRPVEVSDDDIRQACSMLQAAGKTVTKRGVYAISGGDLKRVAKIVDEFNEQQGLNPLIVPVTGQPLSQPGNLSPSDPLLGAVLNLVKIIRQETRQEAQQSCDAENMKLGQALVQANEDLEYAIELNARLKTDLQKMEDGLKTEREGRLKDSAQHAADLKKAQDDFAQQVNAMQKQATDVNESLRGLSEAKAKAENERDAANENLRQATDQLSGCSRQISGLIIAKAQAEGAKTVLESQQKTVQADITQLAQVVQSLESQRTGQMNSLLEAIGRIAEKTGRVQSLAERMESLEVMLSERDVIAPEDTASPLRPFSSRA